MVRNSDYKLMIVLSPPEFIPKVSHTGEIDGAVVVSIHLVDHILQL
jgi:hypothetical protein